MELLVCFIERCIRSEIGSPLIRKNWLLEEQILSFKRTSYKRGKMKMSEMIFPEGVHIHLKGLMVDSVAPAEVKQIKLCLCFIGIVSQI